MEEPLEITDANFKTEILDSDIPAMVDFGAVWCPPCRALEPIIKDLAGEYSGRVKIGKVNVDTCRETAGQFGIMNVPTIIFFNKGLEIERMVGLKSKETIKAKLDTLMD